MKPSETNDLLMIIKAYWQEQSNDDLTLAHWSELLEPIHFSAAKEAVRQRARTGMDRPSAAQVYAEALEYAQRLADVGRTKRIAPEECTPEQAERNKEVLRNIVKDLDEKLALRRWR